jgi:phage protein D
METAGKANIKVIYDGADISEDISASLISLNYTDNVTGKADEVEIKLEDTNGLYSGAWYPAKGSRLTVFINDINCGVFSIDEINVSWNPDTVTWRGISALITSKMRTKNSKGFEGTTLLQIATDIAKNHDLTVDDGTKTITMTLPDTKEEQTKLEVLAKFSLKISSEKNKAILYPEISALMIQVYNIIMSLRNKGYDKIASDLRIALSVLQADMTTLNTARLSTFINKIRVELYQEPKTKTRTLGLGLSKIKIDRSTQNRETDLSYLSRISAEYGLAFNVKPPTMVFYSLKQLEDAPPTFVINKKDITSAELTDKTEGTFANADVSYHDPLSNSTISNKTKRIETIAEQASLNILFNVFSRAGVIQTLDARTRVIADANALIIKTEKGLLKKRYLDEYQILNSAYGFLIADKTTFGCIRFANACKNLAISLKKLQNEYFSENRDSFKGGQASDTLVIRKKVENPEQADAVASSAIHNHNSKTRTGSISMPGNILILAGSNFSKVGFGIFDGNYSIVTSTHSIDKSGGYVTSFDYKQGAIK